MERQPVKELKERTPSIEQIKASVYNFTDTDIWTLEALKSHCVMLRKKMETDRPEDTLDTDRELYHALFELVMRQNESA